MTMEIVTRVDRGLSVDPSYIVRYQVFEDDRFIGDGVVQYHRQADHNDFAIPDTIRGGDGKPLDSEARKKIIESINEAVRPFLQP